MLYCDSDEKWVKEWFNQCVTDYPAFMEKDAPKMMRSNIEILIGITLWYERWFSQFRNK